MKNFFIMLVLFLLSMSKLQSEETIRIISFKEDYLGSFNLQRHVFFDVIEQNPNNYIDTTIVDVTQICRFLTLLKDLKPIKDLNVSTDQIDWDTITVKRDTLLVKIPIEKNSLDNRMYIVYWKDSICKEFWGSMNQIDIDSKRYLLSADLIAFFSEYTPLFDYE